MLISSDLVVAMDRSNQRDLFEICPPGHQHKITMLLSFLQDEAAIEVLDPYFGSTKGFREVFELIDRAVVALVPHIGQTEPGARAGT